MRIWCLFMAFYVLSLNVLGCGDEMSIDNCQFATETHVHLDQDSHSTHADLCSPFCGCACCSIQTTSPSNPIALEFFNIVTYPETVERYIFSVSEFRHSFWQPPKIG